MTQHMSYVSLLKETAQNFWREVTKFWKGEPAPKPKPKPPTVDAELPTEYYFKAVILDQLDYYFKILKRMKGGDKGAYKFYSRRGCHITPGPAFDTMNKTELEPGWIADPPAIGGVMLSMSEACHAYENKSKVLTPRAMYYVQYHLNGRPEEIQPVFNGALYKCTAYWDAPEKGKYKVPRAFKNGGVITEWGIHIAEDGTVRVLRSLLSKPATVRTKKRTKYTRRGETFTVPQRRWGFHDFFKSWAEDHDTSAEEYLKELFIRTANCHASTMLSMTKVRVTKGRLSCLFNVNLLRTPYFFKDRDVTINERGSRRRIFHIVRPHTRHLAGDKESFVRAHFRGERNFKWNDYSVKISVPGWHYPADMDAFNIAAYDERTTEALSEKTIGFGNLAKRLNRLEREIRPWKRKKFVVH